MTWVLCTMMCFSTAITSITPVTVLAKCAHKHTQWVKLVNTTCTKDGKTVYVCNDCNKTLKVVKTRHYGHKFVNYYVAPTCKKGGASGQYCKRCRKRTITKSYPAKVIIAKFRLLLLRVQILKLRLRRVFAAVLSGVLLKGKL